MNKVRVLTGPILQTHSAVGKTLQADVDDYIVITIEGDGDFVVTSSLDRDADIRSVLNQILVSYGPSD